MPKLSVTPVEPLLFLRLPEVKRRTGKSRSALYRAVAAGEFPRPVRVGKNTSVWIESEVAERQRAWIAASRGGKMSAPKKRRIPAGTGIRDYELLSAAKYTASRGRLPLDWRDRLPDPASYYAQHVAKLGKPNALGWAQGQCPFHDDRNASLSVHVSDARGGWRCFASCGGGDLVGFQIKRTGQSFADAVRELIGGRG